MQLSKPNKAIVFKAPEDVRIWLERKATEGYRTVNAQVKLIVESAMRAERESQQ